MPYVRVRKDDGEYEVNRFTDSTGRIWVDKEDLEVFKASLPDGWVVEEAK